MESIIKGKYKFILYLIIFAGIIIRTILYIQNPSLWGDEAGLALNVVNKSFFGLFGELDNLQACPLGFLVISKLLLKVFSPDNMFYRDLVLRFLPFISGIAAVFAFVYLAKLLFKNDNAKILLSAVMISLLPLPVIYSAQYKQYSTEMLVAIVLLITFYKLINAERKNRLLLSFIISVSVWFSYSSVFIIASGFLVLFIKNKKELIKIAIMPAISAIILLVLNLGTILNSTYKNMYDSWSAIPAFLSLEHPLRFFLRMGEFFVAEGKLLSAVVGVLVIYFFLRYVFSKEKLFDKILFCLPLVLVIIASILHMYPVTARLMLFMTPVVIIYMATPKAVPDNIIKIISFAVIIIAAFSYDYHLLYSYARDVVPVLENKIQNKKNIIYDYPNWEYRYYAKSSLIAESKPQISAACVKEYFDLCKGYMNKLEKGEYYFLSHNYYAKQVLDNGKFRIIDDLDIGYSPKETKVVHFEVK